MITLREVQIELKTQTTAGQSESLGASILRLSFGRALVFHSLLFCKCLSGQPVRKCGDHLSVCVAYSYFKSGPVLGDSVCGHVIRASQICGL